ncbi:hypothetical protein NQ317_011848 [Molorchus minor]|uniref:Uncharacterized protein n=1 Tax=Molorchus minor TaxID=1323400 RepID=A0ABQ9JNQ8_9CUCU|nr:hypothetical protein NQ317_011848 [Molorchus minor]
MKSKICKNYTYRFKINLVTVFGDICLRCEENMAAVPQGAFAAKKIRKNEEKRKEYNFNVELNPTNYSSKFMNSIWGQYNRYSVHNLKKIMDDNILPGRSANKEWEFIPGTQTVEKNSFSTEVGSIGSPISFSPQNVYN